MNIKHGATVTNILDMPQLTRPSKQFDSPGENGTVIPGIQPPDPEMTPHIEHFHIKFDDSGEVTFLKFNIYIIISKYISSTNIRLLYILHNT